MDLFVSSCRRRAIAACKDEPVGALGRDCTHIRSGRNWECRLITYADRVAVLYELDTWFAIAWDGVAVEML